MANTNTNNFSTTYILIGSYFSYEHGLFAWNFKKNPHITDYTDSS